MNLRYVPLLFALLTGFRPGSVSGQSLPPIADPLRIPLLLSGNFGELRNNHFHSGLDFKTGGAVGKPVYCADEGYLARIAVSPAGYGNALYVVHPSGLTSVYGHLLRFVPAIADRVRQYQYENERFAVDISFEPGEIPLRKGEQIAFSGNSGSSGGPHLHFELRETVSQAPVDPLPAFRGKVTDSRPPDIHSVALYAVERPGGAYRAVGAPAEAVREADGSYTLNRPLTGWGDLGLGIKAYDRMDGTSHIYGVAVIELAVDDRIVYRSAVQRVSFDESRYLNSFVDYRTWVRQRSFFQKSFVDPGNRLGIYSHTENNGVFTVDEERPYACRYTLRDAFGNRSVLRFTVQGKKNAPDCGTDLPCGERLAWNRSHTVEQAGFILVLPEGALYRDIRFETTELPGKCSHSPRFRLHDDAEPLHTAATLRLRVENDTLTDKKRYYIRQESGKKEQSLTACYADGWLETPIRSFGTFSVATDRTPPAVTPLGVDKWQGGDIRFRIADAESGIADFRGELDGRFALFEYDAKSNALVCRKEAKRWGAPCRRELTLTVTDRCGNSTRFRRTIVW